MRDGGFKAYGRVTSCPCTHPRGPQGLTDDDSDNRMLNRADNYGFSASSARDEACFLRILKHLEYWPFLGGCHSLALMAAVSD
jgi:hypothetical protein